MKELYTIYGVTAFSFKKPAFLLPSPSLTSLLLSTTVKNSTKTLNNSKNLQIDYKKNINFFILLFTRRLPLYISFLVKNVYSAMQHLRISNNED